MPTRRLLFLGAPHLHAYLWRNGEVLHEAAFPNDGTGHQAFAEYLQGKQRDHFYVLADVADESFLHEDLPFVRGKDAKALRQRKLEQYFFGTPFSLAQSQGRAAEGRRDEKLMFAALTRPQQIEPWLAIMQEADVALTGLYSVPFVLPALLGEQIAARDRFVLITLTHGGLRQTYFHNGAIRLSRLTPLATPTVEEAAVNAAAETTKIHQYLVSQRLLARRETLDVLWLADARQFSDLRRACADTDELRFELCDLATLARTHRLRTSLDGLYADALLLHVLVKRRPTVQFAPAGYRRSFRRWQTRTGINIAAALILLAGVLFSARMTFDSYVLNEKTNEANLAETAERLRYDALMASLPPVPTTPDDLRALSARWNELKTGSPRLVDTLAVISQALQQVPSVELDRIDWRLAGSPDGNDKANGMQAQSGGQTYIVADIASHLPAGGPPDQRAQLGLIDRFQAELRQSPGSEVRPLQLPFDVQSDKSLKGTGLEGNKTGQEKLNFSIRYVRKVTP